MRKEGLKTLKLFTKIFLLLLTLSFVALANQTYIVKKGDSLAKIAKKFHVSVKDLIKANNLKKPYIIRVGQKLVIPSKSGSGSTASKSSSQSCQLTYKVKKGDTLIKIAKKYHLWVKDIKKLNNLRSNTLKVGQVLCLKKGSIKSNKAVAHQKKQKTRIVKRVKTVITTYKVKKGDSLSKIAKKFHTSIRTLRKLNGLKKNSILRVGQKLKVPKKVVETVILTERDRLKQLARSMPFGFIWPVDGKVVNGFINDGNVIHIGIDIATDCDAPVRAAESGKVIYANKAIKRYGKLVIIKHIKNFTTTYGNLDKIVVRDQQYVRKGDIIGYAGKINNGQDCGIYFEVRKNAIPINPVSVLPKK